MGQGAVGELQAPRNWVREPGARLGSSGGAADAGNWIRGNKERLQVPESDQGAVGELR